MTSHASLLGGMRTKPAVLGSCCLALVLVMASVASVNLALEGIALDLRATGSDLTWVADGYTVALAALVLPLGAIGDDFGRRKTLVAGTVVFGIGSALAALVDTVELVIACRVVMGIGAAMIMPSTLSTITATFRGDEHDRAVGIWAGFASAGAVLGLLLSGVLLEAFSWRSTFVATAGLALVSLLATVAFVPDTKSRAEPAPDPLGALLSAVGIGALVFGIIEGADEGWGHVVPVVSYVVAVAALTGWILYDMRRERPMLDPRLFALRGFSTGSAALVIQFLGTFGFFYVGLQYVQLVLGYEPLRSALSFLPMAVVVLPLSVLAPRLATRVGHRLVISVGLVCMVVAFVLMARLDVDSTYVDFLVSIVIFSGGLALSATPSTNVIVASLPADKQGVASAVNDVTRELGAAIGIALLGSLFTTGYRDQIAAAAERLPAGAAGLVRDSAAGGLSVAESPRLGGQGDALAEQVREAFMHGMSRSFTVGAVVVAVGLLYILAAAPRRGAAQ